MGAPPGGGTPDRGPVVGFVLPSRCSAAQRSAAQRMGTPGRKSTYLPTAFCMMMHVDKMVTMESGMTLGDGRPREKQRTAGTYHGAVEVEVAGRPWSVGR